VDRQRGTVSFLENEMLGGILDDDTDNLEKSADYTVRQVEALPIADILAERRAPETIDYLSIDFEGFEEWLMLDFPLDRYRFNALTIERPSQARKEKFLAENYITVRETPGVDVFYVASSFKEGHLHNMFKDYGKKRLCLGFGVCVIESLT
jgi:hypothetical protein